MTEVEAGCRAAAARYLTLADAEPDAVRRLGLVEMAAQEIAAARQHLVVAAGAEVAS